MWVTFGIPLIGKDMLVLLSSEMITESNIVLPLPTSITNVVVFGFWLKKKQFFTAVNFHTALKIDLNN